MSIVRLYFDDVYESIPGGDVFLYRAEFPSWGWAIARGCGGVSSHVAITAWRTPKTGRLYAFPLPSRELVLIETLQLRGGRVASLEDQVARYPGRWDWYHVRDHLPYVRRGCVAEAAKVIGKDYGWAAISLAAIRNAAVARWLIPPERDDELNGLLPHCADNASRAMRVGGKLDPVPNRSDRATTPVDFERSAALVYQGSLFWEAP